MMSIRLLVLFTCSEHENELKKRIDELLLEIKKNIKGDSYTVSENIVCNSIDWTSRSSSLY